MDAADGQAWHVITLREYFGDGLLLQRLHMYPPNGWRGR